jgi:hypothetical protein
VERNSSDEEEEEEEEDNGLGTSGLPYILTKTQKLTMFQVDSSMMIERIQCSTTAPAPLSLRPTLVKT